MCIDASPSAMLNVNRNQRKWVEYVLSIHSVQSSWTVKMSTKTAGNDEKKITTYHRGERLCQLCLKCHRTKEEVGKEVGMVENGPRLWERELGECKHPAILRVYLVWIILSVNENDVMISIHMFPWTRDIGRMLWLQPAKCGKLLSVRATIVC